MDTNKYVNIFFGSETYNFTKYSTGLAECWYAYKPIIGNLSPACHLPHRALSVVPYSGGYPCGYGRNRSSSIAAPKRFTRGRTVKGFTHFCQSGTGYIDNFYNYFLISPTGGRALNIIDEDGAPGYYEVKTGDYFARATVGEKYAVEEFTFSGDGAVDIFPLNSGLGYPSFRLDKKPREVSSEINNGILLVAADYGAIKINFAVKAVGGEIVKNGENFRINGKKVTVSLAYSFESTGKAAENLKNAEDFKETKAKAAEAWNKVLNKIEYRGKNPDTFYSALYNALKKPCFEDESQMLGFDYATLWDMYKTTLPLLFLLYAGDAEKAVNGFKAMFDGANFHNARLMENVDLKEKKFSGQASCLAAVTVTTAKLWGVKADYERLIPLAQADVENAFERGLNTALPTHNVDIVDAVCALRRLNESPVGLDAARQRLFGVFDEFGIHMKVFKDSKYYEGCNVSYSFRVAGASEMRLTFTNKEKLLAELDRYFGLTSCKVKNYTRSYLINTMAVNARGDKVRRFSGLNNEPDMDAPFMYHLLGEYGKCEKVVDAGRKKFVCARDGLSGNDDSGGLTSWYVWAAIGLFPVTGSQDVLIFAPEADSVVLHLENADLRIERCDGTDVLFNGEKVVNRRIDVNKLQNGGLLQIPCGK